MSHAVFPMYDWPEIAVHTDALWSAITAQLALANIDAPRAIDRQMDLMTAWLSPDLLIGQTCGLPYTRSLSQQTQVVGTLDYGVPGCAPGWYNSVIVVRADDPRRCLAGFKGSRLAINAEDSQSGVQALMYELVPLSPEERFFGDIAITGAHEFSAASVASGATDIASLDHISWRLIQAHRDHARHLRVLRQTAVNPGLPLITAKSRDINQLAKVIRTALPSLARNSLDALGLKGFVRLKTSDYTIIAERDHLARTVTALHGL